MSKDLHDEIMNLPVSKATIACSGWDEDEFKVYKIGHRDARHAAAELALTYTAGAAKGGNTSGNITKAAANKAAEEGGLTMTIGGKYNWKGQLERLAYLGRNWSGNGYWHQFEKVDAPGVIWCEVLDADLSSFEETKPIAADRASRQVANKAEVEPVAWMVRNGKDYPGTLGIYSKKSDADVIAKTWSGETVPLYATPPATTGASTVLTDERIGQLYEEATSYTLEDDDYAGVRALVRLVEREVAAQAGQVAVPGWISCKDSVPEVGQVVLVACEGWDTPAVLKYQVQPYQRFIDQSSGRWWWHHEAMSWMHLPASPAKESK